MQKTEHFDLGLIESTDPVDYRAINANTEKIDAAIQAQAAALTAAQEALPVKKFAVGTYKGNGQDEITVNVGFTPKVVFVASYSESGFATTGNPATDSTNSKTLLAIIENGFKATENFTGASFSVITYRYVAFG